MQGVGHSLLGYVPRLVVVTRIMSPVQMGQRLCSSSCCTPAPTATQPPAGHCMQLCTWACEEQRGLSLPPGMETSDVACHS